MTRREIFALCVVFASMIPGHTLRADEPKLNVQELYSQCMAPKDSTAAIFCLGFVSGIGDFMQLNGAERKMVSDAQWSVLSNEALCGLPTYGAQVQAFVNWAEKHPEEWGTSRVIGVVIAFRESWPCRPN
jgi:hypothetical protein